MIIFFCITGITYYITILTEPYEQYIFLQHWLPCNYLRKQNVLRKLRGYKFLTGSIFCFFNREEHDLRQNSAPGQISKKAFCASTAVSTKARKVGRGTFDLSPRRTERNVKTTSFRRYAIRCRAMDC